MTTIEKYSTWFYRDGITNATKIIELKHGVPNHYKKKFIFTYRTGNAFETFLVNQYDGEKLNPIATLTDLGFYPEKSAYNLLSEDEIKRRFNMLTQKAIEFIKLLHP